MLQLCSRQVVLAVLLGLGAAAKLDGITRHHGHDLHHEDHHHEDHHHEDHHHEDHNNEDHHNEDHDHGDHSHGDHAHGDQAHSHTRDANGVPVWNPNDIHSGIHIDAGNSISGTLEERFNIQAGSFRHQEFAEAKPDDEGAVRGSYS